MPSSNIKHFIEYLQEIAKINCISENIGNWDKATNLPNSAFEFRNDCHTTLLSIVRDRESAPYLKELLTDLLDNKSLSKDHATLVRLYYDEYNKNNKVPPELDLKTNEATSKAYDVWIKAKQNSDFKSFAPALLDVITVLKERAEVIGYAKEPYDYFLDEFEPGNINQMN